MSADESAKQSSFAPFLWGAIVAGACFTGFFAGQRTRRHAIADLKDSHADLEQRVDDRTSELAALFFDLQRSEEAFRSLFENAPIAYHEIDSHGIIRAVNDAESRLLQVPAAQMIGRPVWEFVAPSERDVSRREVVMKLAGEKALVSVRRTLLRADGQPIHVEIHENLIVNGAGSIRGIRTSLLDITARLEAEERMRQIHQELESRVAERTRALQDSNLALQQFAYSVSHDLQEPLRMVASYTRLIEKRYRDSLDQDGREFLEFVVSGAERMSWMIRDLLTFSRAGGADDEQIEEIATTEVVQTALANLRAAIDESGAQIHFHDLPVIWARRPGLYHVIQNLLSNAIKYRSDAPPEITIQVSADSSEWIFSIRDNGMGFDPQMTEKAFAIFGRLHGRDYPGTGMGLAICKRIVERHGGRIWAESLPGEGSCFWFSIPRLRRR